MHAIRTMMLEVIEEGHDMLTTRMRGIRACNLLQQFDFIQSCLSVLCGGPNNLQRDMPVFPDRVRQWSKRRLTYYLVLATLSRNDPSPIFEPRYIVHSCIPGQALLGDSLLCNNPPNLPPLTLPNRSLRHFLSASPPDWTVDY